VGVVASVASNVLSVPGAGGGVVVIGASGVDIVDIVGSVTGGSVGGSDGAIDGSVDGSVEGSVDGSVDGTDGGSVEGTIDGSVDELVVPPVGVTDGTTTVVVVGTVVSPASPLHD